MNNKNPTTSAHIQTFVDAKVLEWIDFTSSAETALLWQSLGFTPETAQAWREGFTRPLGALPDDAAAYRDEGYTPAEALRQVRRRYPSPLRTR